MIKSSLKLTMLAMLFISFGAAANSVLNEIDNANKAFAKAILAGDLDHLVDEYTEDACIIAPNSPETCGKEMIRGFWQAVIASQAKNVEIITQKAGSDGDMAFATGELLITDATSAIHKNRFVLVFKRIEGIWKLHIDSWTPQ